MTFAQLKQANPEATTHGIRDGSWTMNGWQGGRFALVASLGAIASLGTNQPVSNIEFYVAPHREKFIPGLDVRIPFRGRLGDKLSFHEGSVNKQGVQSRFGMISFGTTNAGETFQFQARGERFWWRLGHEEEELWYTDQGVAFVLKSNQVTSFKIFKAKTPK